MILVACFVAFNTPGPVSCTTNPVQTTNVMTALTLSYFIPGAQAMNNLAPAAIEDVNQPVSGSANTNTWYVTFSAAMGNVPEMSIEEGDADLSSVGADVAIATVEVCQMLILFKDILSSVSRVVTLI